MKNNNKLNNNKSFNTKDTTMKKLTLLIALLLVVHSRQMRLLNKVQQQQPAQRLLL